MNRFWAMVVGQSFWYVGGMIVGIAAPFRFPVGLALIGVLLTIPGGWVLGRLAAGDYK